ncbi:MAG TPA: RNA methyltransferase, partial [Ferruginibacter sp.]|nr:RNA methyltransferase [Ferruginibacter sp.]
QKLSKQELQGVSTWIDPNVPLHFFRHKEDVIAVPQSFEPLIPVLQERLYLRQAGIMLGKLVNNALIPEHALALSKVYNNSVPAISLEKEQALQYLRRAEFMPPVSGKGWTLMQYEGHNLGWAKLLPNRLNNYYPKEWRILKG